tara:strand:+ start:761 stop:1372 length:612 start_codon:yes stop_codon:yes gene_type:complete
MARVISDKLLFIHVPKTGGTFVRELINLQGLCNYETGLFEEHDHKGISDLQDFKNLVSFGIIRKPYEWIISRWKWGIYTEFEQKVKGGTKAKEHWMADVWSNDINEFLFNTINKRSGIAEETMFNLLQIGKPNQVNYILKAENLKYDLIKLFIDELNVDLTNNFNKIKNNKTLNLNDNIKFPFFKEQIEKQNLNLINMYYETN